MRNQTVNDSRKLLVASAIWLVFAVLGMLVSAALVADRTMAWLLVAPPLAASVAVFVASLMPSMREGKGCSMRAAFCVLVGVLGLSSAFMLLA